MRRVSLKVVFDQAGIWTQHLPELELKHFVNLAIPSDSNFIVYFYT